MRSWNWKDVRVRLWASSFGNEELKLGGWVFESRQYYVDQEVLVHYATLNS